MRAFSGALPALAPISLDWRRFFLLHERLQFFVLGLSFSTIGRTSYETRSLLKRYFRPQLPAYWSRCLVSWTNH